MIKTPNGMAKISVYTKGKICREYEKPARFTPKRVYVFDTLKTRTFDRETGKEIISYENLFQLYTHKLCEGGKA